MNLRIITASAGTGKTWRLTEELAHALEAGRARPGHVLATTFTVHAAAELVERARARLLAVGRHADAQQLLAARVGTVNAVCGSLVWEFAFELGLSPDVRVLDEASAELELRRALAGVVDEALADELDGFTRVFERDRDWRVEVQHLMSAARANGLTAEALAACAAHSCEALHACLGPLANRDLDAALLAAIDTARVDPEDVTKKTAEYFARMRDMREDLARGHATPWGGWASLARESPGKKSCAAVAPIQAIAHEHLAHPRLRRELHRLIALQFQVASEALTAYQVHKRERGVIDFIDQEALALEALRRPEIRAELVGELDLFMVDEFQDTSPLQLAVFLELAALARESIWVGDPKQAIYGFRGTDPALMDAAIESLSSGVLDPDLVSEATDAIGAVETLSVSRRSRPPLVEATNAIFAPAFARHGIPEAHTRITTAVEEAQELGRPLGRWRLDAGNARASAAAVAAGVRDLLATDARVRGRDGALRPLEVGDIAVLCRTNQQCRHVAGALAALGIAAVLPRAGLLATLEGRLLHAALALWIDPRDGLAAAEIVRLVDDGDAFVADALAAPRGAVFLAHPVVVAIVASRRDALPTDAVEAAITAAGLRVRCAGWGDTMQRFANLDAFRAHAAAYDSQAHAPTTAGFLRYVEDLAAGDGWRASSSDAQAVAGAGAAVAVSTWHAAKGLEWPVAVLFGLESMRTPSSFGVHVIREPGGFDVHAPLAGRWIRSWPNPYTTTNQLGAVRTAVEATSAHFEVVGRAQREALRVLYVGWTRARDRLVLAARDGQLLGGIIGVVTPASVAEPTGTRVDWGGCDVEILVSAFAPLVIPAPVPAPGWTSPARPIPMRAPARVLPSLADPVACRCGEVVRLGSRIALRGPLDMTGIGDAVHAFLAADRMRDRDELARSVIAGHGVDGQLCVAELMAIADRLWAWTDARYPTLVRQREWPIHHRLPSGTVVAGSIDLLLAGDGGVVVIDHKTFPGTTDAAMARALGYSGQLAAYAAALERRVLATWIHFPIRGELVEVKLGDDIS